MELSFGIGSGHWAISNMDWMTLTIEILGACIFCVWVIIPVTEYRSIYRRLRNERGGPGFPVIPVDDQKEKRS